MKIKNGWTHFLTSALSDFSRNKIRTALTSLGILIGVLSVVMLIALGLGLKNYIQEQFENLGANVIFILPGSGFGGSGGAGFAGIVGGAEFDEKDIASLKRIRQVEYLVPVYFKSAQIEAGREKKTGYVMGVNEDFFPLMDMDLLAGKVFDKSAINSRAKVAVIGYNLADNLFEDPQDGLNKTLRLDGLRLKVIGVAEKTGDNETDNAVALPYTTTFGTLNPDKSFWAIYLGVIDDEAVPAVKKQAEETLLDRYKEDQFSVTEQSEILSTVNQIFSIINLVLLAIGSISLIVGGIGIMNIMYATVTERIKEIGIRRAIGATKRDILLQFLTESVLLSLFGGILGLLLSVIIVLIVRFFFPVALNLVAVVVAFGVSSLIGVFFGVFPARRAANLAPIEAIRHE